MASSSLLRESERARAVPRHLGIAPWVPVDRLQQASPLQLFGHDGVGSKGVSKLPQK